MLANLQEVKGTGAGLTAAVLLAMVRKRAPCTYHIVFMVFNVVWWLVSPRRFMLL